MAHIPYQNTEINCFFRDLETRLYQLTFDFEQTEDFVSNYHKWLILKSRLDNFIKSSDQINEFALEKISNFCIKLNDDPFLKDIIHLKESNPHLFEFSKFEEKKLIEKNDKNQNSVSLQDKEDLDYGQKLLDDFAHNFYYHKLFLAKKLFDQFLQFRDSKIHNLDLYKVKMN